MRVLVVEDEADLGDVFRDLLSELGHQATVVRSAEAALAALGAEPPDAIVLDIQLPGMSGLDFLELRPVQELGVPIVAVSGVVTEAQARECLRRGAVDFVGKPVPLERLSDLLTVLELHALSRHAERVPPPERRRSPRARVAFPVTVTDADGREHAAAGREIGIAGIKARLDVVLERASVVRLRFTPPDGGPPIGVIALLRRVDPDGHAFAFVDLPEGDARRLETLVGGRGMR